MKHCLKIIFMLVALACQPLFAVETTTANASRYETVKNATIKYGSVAADVLLAGFSSAMLACLPFCAFENIDKKQWQIAVAGCSIMALAFGTTAGYSIKNLYQKYKQRNYVQQPVVHDKPFKRSYAVSSGKVILTASSIFIAAVGIWGLIYGEEAFGDCKSEYDEPNLGRFPAVATLLCGLCGAYSAGKDVYQHLTAKPQALETKKKV